MSITYLADEHSANPKKYILSYSELREQYRRFVDMTDEEFLRNLPSAIHFACFMGWFKELGAEATLSDKGIVHELAHLLDLEEYRPNLHGIREQFKTLLKLD